MFVNKLSLKPSLFLKGAFGVLSIFVLILETDANAVTVAVSEQNVYQVGSDGSLGVVDISDSTPSSIVFPVATYGAYYVNLSQGNLTFAGTNTSGSFAIDPLSSTTSSAGPVQGIAAIASLVAALLVLL